MKEDIYKHIDVLTLPQATHRAPIWNWSEYTQQRIFENFQAGGEDVITIAHRVVGNVVLLAQAMALFGAGISVLLFFYFEQMFDTGAVGKMVAIGSLFFLAMLFGVGVALTAHLQTASKEDFHNIGKLSSKIRQAGVWVDWSGPYKYEYSFMLWYLERMRIEKSRRVREQLIEVAQRYGRGGVEDMEKPLL